MLLPAAGGGGGGVSSKQTVYAPDYSWPAEHEGCTTENESSKGRTAGYAGSGSAYHGLSATTRLVVSNMFYYLRSLLHY